MAAHNGHAGRRARFDAAWPDRAHDALRCAGGCRQRLRPHARAKGLAEPRVFARHVLGAALVPILTVSGIGFGGALGGALVIEQVFSLPGVGRLVIGAVLRRDWPVIQGGLLLTAAVFVLVNLLVDVLYLWADPRLRER